MFLCVCQHLQLCVCVCSILGLQTLEWMQDCALQLTVMHRSQHAQFSGPSNSLHRQPFHVLPGFGPRHPDIGVGPVLSNLM